MTQTIKIKRSTGSSAPSTLAQGELAYSKGSDTFYVGDPQTANTPIAIGGAIKNNAGTPQLATGITAGEIRSLLDTEAGTDMLAYDANLQGFVDAFTLPTTDGTALQVLQTDGSGNITFASVSADDVDVSVANLQTRLSEISSNTTIGDASDVTVTMAGALTVTGDLTVNGTTTTVNSETVTVDDNIIVLNNNVTGTPTENSGVEVERGTSTNVLLRWNETSDRWEFTNDGSTYYNIPLSTEYTNNQGDITSIQISSTDNSISGLGTTTQGAASFDLEVATVDGGTY